MKFKNDCQIRQWKSFNGLFIELRTCLRPHERFCKQMSVLAVLAIFYLQLFPKFSSDQNRILIYDSPKYSLQNPNLTLVGFFDISNENKIEQFQAISAVAAIMCAVDKYNQGYGIVPVKGTFNVILHDSSVATGSREYDLVRNGVGPNLHFASNSSEFSPSGTPHTGVIISDGTINSVTVSAAITSKLSITSLFDSYSTQDLRTSYYFSDSISSYTGNYVLSHPSPINVFLGMTAIASLYSWTLIGIAFSSSVYGFSGQKTFFILNSLFESKVTVPCINVISILQDKSPSSYDISSFANCITGTSQIRVVVLWMSPEEASIIAEALIKYTGLKDQFVFILPSVTDKIFVARNLPEMTFFFSPSGQIFDGKLNNCSASAQQEISQYLENQSIDVVELGDRYCYYSDPESPVCNSLVTIGSGCNCSDTYIASYAVDVVNTVMMGIYNMQSNCSFMNACAKVRYPDYQNDFCTMTEFDLSDLTIAINCVRFIGVSGRISFFNRSFYRAEMPLDVLQVQSSHEFKTVGIFSYSDAFINKDLIYFHDNKTITSKIVVDDPNITNNALVAVFFGLDVALMVITVAFALFIVVYWRNRVIRKSSPIFCLLMLLGLLFGEMALLLYSMPSSDILCRAVDWFLLLGISLIIGGLLAKNYRIYRIFGNRSAQALKISDLDLFCFTGAVILITSILLVLYMTVGGPLILYEQQSESNIYYFYTICLVGNSGVQTGFTIAFYVYFVLLFIAAAILAFLNRKVDDAYNESGDLGFIACSWIALATIYAPIYYVQSSGTNSNTTRFVLRYMAVEIAIALMLFVFFMPKILAARRHYRKI